MSSSEEQEQSCFVEKMGDGSVEASLSSTFSRKAQEANEKRASPSKRWE